MLCPVDVPVLQLEFGREGDVAALDFAPRGAVGDRVHDAHQQFGAGECERVEQASGGLLVTDRLAEVAIDLTGVELGYELEHRGSRDLVAGDECALHRCRATPARQQGEVEVDPPEPRSAQERFADEAAVGDDDPEVGLQLLHPLGRESGEPIGLDHRKRQLVCGARHRSLRELPPPALRRVLAGDDGGDVVPARCERLQARHRRGGASRKDDDQVRHCAARSFWPFRDHARGGRLACAAPSCSMLSNDRASSKRTFSVGSAARPADPPARLRLLVAVRITSARRLDATAAPSP